MMDNETVNIDGVLKGAQKKLGKDYEFIRHLGGGEFSNVYLVKHHETGQEHALKILDYHYLLQRLKKEDWQNAQIKFNEIKKRFITEARLYKKIHHPNIVSIHDTGVITEESKGIEIPYMIMSYIRGSSLSDLLRNEAPFDMGRALSITRDVLGALDAMHENNIIHRDIKPGNIMIEEDSGEAIIIDFGIAKDIVGGTRLTTTGALLGSPMYMAPEQSMDSSNVGPHTDIYSYGAVMFEMLTGETPFQGCNFMEIMTAHRERPVPNARERNPRLPHPISDILCIAMAKNPQDRFPRTGDFLEAFEKAVTDPTAAFALYPKTPGRYKKYYKYIFAIIILTLAAVFLLDPLGIMKKESLPPALQPIGAKKIETVSKPPKASESENKALLEKQTREMNTTFASLKEFLDTDAANEKKIERIQAFIDQYGELPTAESPAEEARQLMTRLNTQVQEEYRYKEFITSAKKYGDANDYDKAAAALDKAKAIKDNEEITALAKDIAEKKHAFEQLNGKTAYESIKSGITLARFLEFREKYPDSVYLPELKDGLIQADSHLPPEKYWDSLRLNARGYYEYKLPVDNNYHRMIYIPERKLWIDKYEVSNKHYRDYLASENKPVPAKSSDQYIHDGPEYPAVVSYDDAEKYCQRYGFRLPRAEEWEYAAGKRLYTYPWGNQNPGEQEVWRANFDSLGEDGQVEKDKFEGTAPVTSFEDFSSPFGAFNMAGNVWEWVQGRILKGGSFLSAAEELAVRNSIAGRSDDTQGFRCVKDEE